MNNAEYCNKCGGYNYYLLGCCSGRECGCMGKPVDAKPCSECNQDGEKEPSDEAKENYPWFFLNEVEFAEYEKSKAKRLAALNQPQGE